MNRKAQTASRVEEDPDAYPLPADSVQEPPDPAEIASYIADITDELAKMAANAGLETICYLLTLARLEAESITGESEEDAG
jgi:hypothetical protein